MSALGHYLERPLLAGCTYRHTSHIAVIEVFGFGKLQHIDRGHSTSSFSSGRRRKTEIHSAKHFFGAAGRRHYHLLTLCNSPA